MRVGIVSRGYKRRSKGVMVVSDGTSAPADAEQGGDEPVLLARRLDGARVVVAERRADGARTAVRDLGAQVLLLDDGFQHRSLRRDLDIVILDGRYDISREPMLPAGRRREPLGGLRRADMLVYSKWPHRGHEGTGKARRSRWESKPSARFHYVPEAVLSVQDDRPVSPEELAGKTVFAFSGIVDHRGFLDQLRTMGLAIGGSKRYRDHHQYTEDDIASLELQKELTASRLLITTEKDAVKLKNLAGGTRMVYLRIRIEMCDGCGRFLSMVDNCAAGRKG
jgi:tetraacyldisaccharide 4'-kinase